MKALLALVAVVSLVADASAQTVRKVPAQYGTIQLLGDMDPGKAIGFKS